MSEVDYSKETPIKYMKMTIIYSIVILAITALTTLYYYKYDFTKIFKPIGILTSVIVIFMIYKYHKIRDYLENNPTFFSKGINADKSLTIKRNFFRKPKDNHSFMFMFDLFIESYKYKYGKTKNIMRKGFGKNVCPEINLEPNVNNMNISFMLDNGDYKTIQLKDIPINKYVNIAIQFNNNTVEIYRNGLLVNANAYSSRPLLNDSDLELFSEGGVKGNMSNLYYSPNYHNAQEIRLKVGKMQTK